MSSERKQYTTNQYLILYNEVDGLCPLCGIELIYEKANKLNKRVNLAHIYPHSPTKEEKILLEGVEKLSEDVDSIDNIIWLCPNCHEKFDKPRTLDGYNKLIKMKKRFIQGRLVSKEFNNYKIEEEIKDILLFLANYEYTENDNTLLELKYNPETIDNKTDITITNLKKRKIKQNVREFFHILKKEFQNIDTTKPNKSTKIATQIKSFYNEVFDKTQNQEEIYDYLVEWLHKKTNKSKDASSIVVSYFVQNCEVFDVVS
ncbi:ABC-three component system protein [Aliarcobacter butzleri]|uniref:ABC-three component system protein n=1 Tax=Aliarcobacter butzleri TaxID=28197 RepID=UPI001EDA7CB9|nr:ABC-three component system protein [Aliarcobacter butzleri]MCG3663015.1 HNH endonuclease [Aliarcobacter butzleri]MCP3649346.1 HNH endonuclease [Arcobacter sp. DNRA7]MCR1815519.1 HNH endonuclease [Aliarcobacter butzleri]